jgi:transposase
MDDLTFFSLQMMRVGAGGKRGFDPADKQRLIDACLYPCASLSGLTLKTRANANQSPKQVWLREESNASARDDAAVASSTLVPVVVIDDAAAVPI